MLKLNIMPKKHKDGLKHRQLLEYFKSLLFIVLFFVILNAIILLAAKLILQIDFVKTIERTAFITKNTENYSRNVKEINKQMTAIAKIQDDSVLWSRLLARLSETMPVGVKLSLLKVDKTAGTIQMQGYAPTREKLLELKENFENTKLFGEINFPIKNLLEKTNINFDITSKITNYGF